MLLAKSSGVSLVTHSTNVAVLAKIIALQTLRNVPSLDIRYYTHMVTKVSVAGLLHDIGKAHGNFQKKLTDDNGDEILGKNKFRHNEIGWAFLSKYYTSQVPDFFNLVLDSVYWHHGISNIMGEFRNSEILEDITEDDVQAMEIVMQELFTIFGDANNTLVKHEQPDIKTPTYYSDQDLWSNSERSFIRMCVCSADRLVSKLELEGDISYFIELIKKLPLRTGVLSVNANPYPSNGTLRFEKQLDVVNKSGQTTLVKGPAGFGKTLAAIMWAAKSNKKLIWVCPRNSVAYSVYDSVCNELKATGNDNISVELFLTNEVKKTTHNNLTGFDSDIIVTNIDNFLSPTVNYSNGTERLFLINSADVVFDEFHELISDSALFASFITMVNVRHRLTDSRTLLLSATPSIICNKYWNSPDNMVVILPSNDSHYPAAHEQKYKINILNVEPSPTNGDLIVQNTIFAAQATSVRSDNTYLIHSKYTDEDKAERYEMLIKNYGKNNTDTEVKKPVVGSHVVQASLDVSFKNLSESVLSPESTLQRIGRCNRWGDMGDGCKINLFSTSDKGESNIIQELYTPELNLLWWDELKSLNNSNITLDELYSLYNKFNIKHKDKLTRHINILFNASMDNLSVIHPIKFTGVKSSDGVHTAGGNKLRVSNNSIFYICKKFNSDEWIGPFTVNIHRNIGEEFGEGNIGNPTKKVKQVMESLIGDSRFDYGKVLKKPDKYLTLDNFRIHAKKSNTPYIRFNEVYHPELGLISTERINVLISN
jgi:CRISPR-associated endonuclease Cas3-HD